MAVIRTTKAVPQRREDAGAYPSEEASAPHAHEEGDEHVKEGVVDPELLDRVPETDLLDCERHLSRFNKLARLQVDVRYLEMVVVFQHVLASVVV